MDNLRHITPQEQEQLRDRGCYSEDWNLIWVTADFSPSQLLNSRLGGEVMIGKNARIFSSNVKNYSIADNSIIESVTLMECNRASYFGNGVEVAALNECGGRSVKIFAEMTAQQAYMATMYRHRDVLIKSIDSLVESYAAAHASHIGSVGRNCSIVGARIIREVNIGDGVTIEGASMMENGTLGRGSKIGPDVKACNFITAESALVDRGTTIERCFVGENVILSNGFTAVDSLFFASSHCENGEAASIFAGPYTVSHHKSSLLIAGMFSFFNAGSGSNQSNHLFKCGAVHQGVHMRGCKFGSSAYVMLPAVDGAFTTVMGSHNLHHDSSPFPFSYLVSKDGRSSLIPAANLTSYGYVRDVEKWVNRDRRTTKRDVVSYDEYNPYIAGAILRAINTLNELVERHPDIDQYVCNKLIIKSSHLKRGVTLYNKAIVAALGSMLSKGEVTSPSSGLGEWLDVAGQYITKSRVDQIIEGIESSQLGSLEAIDAQFKSFAREYDSAAYSWAYSLLGQLLAHEPTDEDIRSTIESGVRTHNELRAQAERDRRKDFAADMMVSYGLDHPQDRETDFNRVRGVEQ